MTLRRMWRWAELLPRLVFYRLCDWTVFPASRWVVLREVARHDVPTWAVRLASAVLTQWRRETLLALIQDDIAEVEGRYRQ